MARGLNSSSFLPGLLSVVFLVGFVCCGNELEADVSVTVTDTDTLWQYKLTDNLPSNNKISTIFIAVCPEYNEGPPYRVCTIGVNLILMN